MFERNDSEGLEKTVKNEFEFSDDFQNTIRQEVAKTFIWMALGVVVTGVVATFCYNSYDFWVLMASNRFMPLILLAAQFGVVIAISARLFKMKVNTARFLYLFYAALLGVTCSVLGVAYAGTDIAIAFGLSAAYFIALAVIGYTTRINLLKFGPILYVGLFIMVGIEIVMMFMGMDTSSMIFTGIGLALFTGITAYDTQKMKVMFSEYQNDSDMMKRISVYSAFQLYLDFINIFLYILRIVGDRK